MLTRCLISPKSFDLLENSCQQHIVLPDHLYNVNGGVGTNSLAPNSHRKYSYNEFRAGINSAFFKIPIPLQFLLINYNSTNHANEFSIPILFDQLKFNSNSTWWNSCTIFQVLIICSIHNLLVVLFIPYHAYHMYRYISFNMPTWIWKYSTVLQTYMYNHDNQKITRFK
jgi:hypothetical protein